MKTFLSLLLALLPVTVCAQTSGSLWTNYLSYRHAERCEAVGGLVYGVFGGNLLSYDEATDEVQLYYKDDGLGGKGIIATAASDRLVVLYGDGMVDVIDPATDAIGHITALKTNSGEVGDAVSLACTGKYAVVGTSKGVALLDVERLEVRGFYTMDGGVTSAAYSEGKVFAVCGGRLMAGNVTDNLYDASNWQRVHQGTALFVAPAAGGVYVQTLVSGLQWLSATDYTTRAISSARYDGWHRCGTRCAFVREGEAAVVSDDAPTAVTTFTLDGTPEDLLPVGDTRFYLCRGDEGLQAWKAGSDGTLIADGTAITGYGPQTDRTGFMNFVDGGRLLTSGGSFDYYETTFYAPNAGYIENGNWTFLQTEGVAETAGTHYRSLTSMAQDPTDAAHHFVATGDYGLFEFRDGAFVRQYNLDNSPLRPFWSNSREYVRVDGLCYDAAGNLWMGNEQVDTVLRALKPDGTWRSVFVNDIKGCRHICQILFDRDGRLWAAQRDWIGSMRGGVLCVELGNTDDPDDHTSTFRYNARNEDGTAVDFSQGVNCLLQDASGRIWFGAYSGVFVIDNPAEFAGSDFLVTQVKVPRNDGTNYADYLLDGTPCTAIATDGADRKWIGTENNGIYLVSSDGTEILEHFDSENSPLPSDRVLSVAVHPDNGEVFIGTDAGIVSYQSYVTRAAESLRRDDVQVYPNPVRPDKGGVVTISGLTAEADVKITTAAGFAVAAGTSTGGTFRWDCTDTSGRRVAAGIYYILVATKDGGDHIAAKVAVVR